MASSVAFSADLRKAFRAGKQLVYPEALADYFATEIQERLQGVKRSFPKILYQGPPLCSLVDFLDTQGDVTLLLNGGTQEELKNHKGQFFYEEVVPFSAASFDLVISVMHLHAVQDIQSFLFQYRALLNPDGMMLCIFPGNNTFQEIRTASMAVDMDFYGGAYSRTIPFLSLESLARLMQQVGFELPVVDVDRHSVDYESLRHVCQDLSEMGEQNFLEDKPRGLMTPRYFKRLEEELKKEKETFSVTLEFLFGQGWASGALDAKTLRPGQGKTSLKKILE